MSQPEGIAKNDKIRDHVQQLSPDPAEIKKKSAFPSGCIFRILLSRRMDYRPIEKQKLRYFWLSRILNGPKNRLKTIEKTCRKIISNSQKSKASNGYPEGIAKKYIILDHSQWLYSGPAKIKLFSIALRMHFLNTFTSENEVSIQKKSFLIDEGLKWV